MASIDYFKMQAKNLLKDFNTRFFDEQDHSYHYNSVYFDISAIFGDNGIPDKKEDFSFTLMNAQHLIAKLAGFSHRKELVTSPPNELEAAQRRLNKSGYTLRQKSHRLPAPQNLYAFIVPNGVFGISVEFSFTPVEYAKKYMIYSSDENDTATAQPLAEGEFSPIKYIYRGQQRTHKCYWVRAFDGTEYGEWSALADKNR